MVDLQTISIGLAALSFILAVTYYTFNMRHARETRQAQLFMQLASEIFSKEMLRARVIREFPQLHCLARVPQPTIRRLVY